MEERETAAAQTSIQKPVLVPSADVGAGEATGSAAVVALPLAKVVGTIYRGEEHSQVPGLAKQGKKNLMPRLFLPPSSWEAGQYSRLQQRSESKLQISFSMRSDSSFVCLKAPIAFFEPQVTQQLFLLQQQ